jgi:uridylate kinase
MMAVISISIGGSILVPGKPDLELVRALAAILARKARTHKLICVIGGGTLARDYIEPCRALGADESFLDEVGIAATRLNASVLLAALQGRAYHKVAFTLDEGVSALQHHNIVVMGGTHPGHTTDAVTVFMAEKARADRILITTNVDGVYTADPKTDPNATLLPNLTPERLVEIAGKMAHSAGSKGVIDPIGAKLIARSRILTYVLDGRDLRNLEAAIDGRKFHGTVVSD